MFIYDVNVRQYAKKKGVSLFKLHEAMGTGQTNKHWFRNGCIQVTPEAEKRRAMDVIDSLSQRAEERKDDDNV